MPGQGEWHAPFTGRQRAAHYAACLSHLNHRDWEALGTCYAADAVAEHVDSGLPAARGQAIREIPRAFAAGFPDLASTSALTLVHGHQVVSLLLVTGTQRTDLALGPALRIPATHRPVGFLVGDAVAYGDDDTIHQDKIFFDLPTLTGQLGVSGPAGRPMATALEAAPVLVIAAGGETERSNVAAYQKLNAGRRSHDRRYADALADDVVESDVVAADRQGKQAVFSVVQQSWKGFSDFKTEIIDLWGAGDYTVAVLENSGTNDADVEEWGLKKTGAHIDFTSLEIMRWEAGKVAHSWVLYNSAETARKLGT